MGMGAGGIFARFGSPGALGRLAPPDTRHFPYVRVLLLDWEQTPTGFTARGRDESRFEVVCASCGDDDGPAEYQPEPARRLRGPYDRRKDAEKAAHRHELGTVPSRSSGMRMPAREVYREAIPRMGFRRYIRWSKPQERE